MNKNVIQSYVKLITSMLIFGTIGIFRRFIPLSSGLLACTRGLLGSLFLVSYIGIKRGSLSFQMQKKDVFLLALTGALIGLNWIFLFEAFNHTTIAIATLCYYMEPTIVVLLAPIVFHEKLTTKKLICAMVSILGMVFVSGVGSGAGSQGGNLWGIIFGLIAAVLYSVVVLLNKKIEVEDAYEKTLIQLFTAALVTLPYLAITEDFSAIQLDLISLVMLLIVGLLHTGIAYAMYFSSMRFLKAQSIAILSYIDPVSALILAGIFLDETLSILGVVGAILIIGSALISEISVKKKG